TDHRPIERVVRDVSFSADTATLPRTAFAHVVRYLAGRYPQPVQQSRAERSDTALLTGLDGYLSDLRGLSPKSREEILRAAGRVLGWYRGAKPHRPVGQFSAKDVLAYASYAARRVRCDRTRSAAMSHLRDFLRYLRWSGICP